MVPKIDIRARMARRFRESLVKRVAEAAPGTRVTLTLWNDSGRVTDEKTQRFTVASKHCSDRVFEIPSADLDRAFSDEFAPDPDAQARARVLAIQDKMVLALIGREPSKG